MKFASLARLCCILIGVLPMISRGVLAADSFYGHTIYSEVTQPCPRLAAALEDFHDILQKVTGEPFRLAEVRPETGIVLALKSSPNLPAEVRKGLAGLSSHEGLVIWSEGDRYLWLAGNSEVALADAIYQYLYALGCRFLGPDPTWQILPKLTTLSRPLDLKMEPVFQVRTHFGTGGFGGDLPLDPNRSLQKRWELFLTRNGFGGEGRIWGHTGEAFFAAHKKELEADPAMIALQNDGKRSERYAKICVSNSKAVDLYTDFILKDLEMTAKQNDTDLPVFGASVEPADGGGECRCPECLKIGNGSPTDVDFHLANHMAQEIAEKSPGTRATILAYNMHALPPSIPLADNLFVVAVPYGFNYTGFSGDELLSLWSKKHPNRIGIYDYWSIPDWVHSMPDPQHGVQRIVKQLNFFRESGVKALMTESTYALGTIGPLLYVYSRWVWDPEVDTDRLFREYFQLLYGPAAGTVEGMYRRWEDGFLPSSHEVGKSYRDLEKAFAEAGDNPEYLARLVDLTAYVRHMEMRVRMAAAPDLQTQKEEIIEYIKILWRAYDSSIVQSFRENQLVLDRMNVSLKTDPDLMMWDTAGQNVKDVSDNWKQIKKFSTDDAREIVSEGIKANPVLTFQDRKFGESLIPLNDPDLQGNKYEDSGWYGMDTRMRFVVPAGTSELDFAIVTENKPRTWELWSPVRARVFRVEDHAMVFEGKFDPDGREKHFTIPTAKPGTYELEVQDNKQGHKIRAPKGIPFVYLGEVQSLASSPRMFFYVPKGTKSFGIFSETLNSVQVFGPEDERVLSGTRERMVEIPVPAGQDGQIWSFEGARDYVRTIFFGVPQVFSFSKESLMVPKELAKESREGFTR